MLRIAQLSDAHLSSRDPIFQDHLEAVRRWLTENPVDLIIASGDLALDGAGMDADMAVAASLHKALPAPILSVPGNHDVGDLPRFAPTQPVNTERLARFRAHAGADFWMRDLEDGPESAWRLIGLNSQIMGSGLPDEAEQAYFLADALASAGSRPLAVFLHKPIFIETPEESEESYWAVPPEPRRALMPLLHDPRLRLVASGHLHLHHSMPDDRVQFHWAPPLSFIVEPEIQQGLPGKRIAGFLLHELSADSVETSLITPEGVAPIWLETVRDRTYPR